MAVTPEEVIKIANLAGLSFTSEEVDRLTHELNRILEYMDKLNELDTVGVEPLHHVLDMKNVFRQDEVRPSLPREQILSNAPDAVDGYFRVPKVIG
jgi:aspartyl-tRNA(Asn)/glutamyl-tRNA(Gln) amidotransferase subunit C